MTNLVFKRKKRPAIEPTGQVVIKINAESYNKVWKWLMKQASPLEVLFPKW